MIPEEIEALLGAYALDAVDEDERREVEEYLVTHPRARAEVDQYQEVAAMLAFSGSDAPAGVWDRIASAIEGESGATGPGPLQMPSVPSLAPVIPLVRRSRAPWYALGGLAAAAAVVVAVLVSMVAHRNNELSAARSPGVEAATKAALVDPNTRKVNLVSADGKQRMEVALAGGIGFGMAQGLPALPADKTYQLWGQYEGKVVSLGLLGRSPTAIAFPATEGLKALMITQEEAGGVVATANAPLLQGALA
ncbi:MAG: hypothetical protein JWL70_1586 [Acidimicrobiia bacterium]|nr:hypothetical protein [Acidimicrobiia bacterium]